ncbi:MAG TPA: branched-chain amino acid ABC transporter permease [Anaeromyxobacteraceae bacterium]|nr:branched-chain amino acid ABC transporter permease [Anaeromyxobacteraceae bacterium]
MTEFLQHVVNGLSLGTIYALIALGYTMVYGVLKLINFAHGDVYMVGAFAGYYVATALDVERSPSLAKALVVFVGSMAVCGALGFVVERFAYRPLRNRPRLASLITAIGVSFLLEFGFQLPSLRSQAESLESALFGFGLRLPDFLHRLALALPDSFPPGPTPRFFPEPFERVDWTVLGGVHVSNYDVVSLGVAFAFMVGLQLIVYRTKFGTAMRAVSFDARTAGLMGIPVGRVISGTFVLGSVLAAVAALLVAGSRPRIDPIMGLMPGLKAFVAAVFGGIGSVPGAMVGGLVLGFSEEMVAGYTVSSFRDGIAFAMLILVLLIRPEGLFGRVTVEKV